MFRLVRMFNRSRWQLLFWCLLFTSLYQLGGAGAIKAKAWLAPYLIDDAWHQTLSSGVVGQKPWPWADTWPVARLQVPGHGIDLLILAGDSGNALAFGPGHTVASAALGTQGLAVIGGHRDTHFAFLQYLAAGDELQLQLPSGELRSYRVDAIRVVDADQESLLPGVEEEELLLVTCYPFNTLRSGGSLRYTVTSSPVHSSNHSSS